MQKHTLHQCVYFKMDQKSTDPKKLLQSESNNHKHSKRPKGCNKTSNIQNQAQRVTKYSQRDATQQHRCKKSKEQMQEDDNRLQKDWINTSWKQPERYKITEKRCRTKNERCKRLQDGTKQSQDEARRWQEVSWNAVLWIQYISFVLYSPRVQAHL